MRGLTRFALLAILLTGCQSSQIVTNSPLPLDAAGAPVFGGGYSLLELSADDPADEILVLLAFSGGGTRSAAFAHGALRGLRDIPMPRSGAPGKLLDDVDYIAAVSGGSFPAMDYGLKRDKTFDTFPNDFLYRNIDAFIWGTFLLPWNWEWLINPLYGTNDRMSEVYDRLLFHGATYGDLQKKGLPLISVNATDIANGAAFAFTQTYFDLICSDLSSFPVSRAVAASAGFPILFTPITLTSHRADCGDARPPNSPRAGLTETDGALSRRAVLARLTEHYLDPERARYVHLLDGGISDNLALRSMLNWLIALEADGPTLRRLAPRTRRVLIISVDGQASTDPTISKRRVVTGLGQIFGAVSGAQINAYSFETLLLADQELGRLVGNLRRARCDNAPVLDGYKCDDVDGALVHISLEDIPDPEERARLQAVRTGLTIPGQDVDSLMAWGQRLILDNPVIRKAVADVAAPPEPAPRRKVAAR